MIKVSPVPAFSDNYIWVLHEDGGTAATVVDPGEAAPVRAFLEHNSLQLAAILITHHHPDHTNGLAELTDDRIPVYGPAQEKVPGVTVPVGGDDSVRLAHPDLTLGVLDVPGHTLGHIAYTGRDILLSGDALFSVGCGRLFEGTAEQMLAGLTAMRELPATTRIYCGHEYTLKNIEFALAVEPENRELQARQQQAREQRNHHQPTLPTTLEQERQTNPFLRWDVPAVHRAASDHAGRPLDSAAEVLAALRAWKDSF